MIEISHLFIIEEDFRIFYYMAKIKSIIIIIVHLIRNYYYHKMSFLINYYKNE